MLFAENQLDNILYGFNTIYGVASDYFEENRESILEVHDHLTGYIEIVKELDKQVKEYEHFKYAKAKNNHLLELVKESLKVSEGFEDLQLLKANIEDFKGTSVYFQLFNVFNDELIKYSEKVIALYGDLLGACAYYKGDFNSFYYTYFIEKEDVTEEDVMCFTIDRVNEWLAE